MKHGIDPARILALLKQVGLPLGLVEIERGLRVLPRHRSMIRLQLARLVRAGDVRKLPGNRWVARGARSAFVHGTFQMSRRGFGFVRASPGQDGVKGDIYIPAGDENVALDGDVVRAEVLRMDDRGPAGRIVEVLEHRHRRIAGWFQMGARSGEVHPRHLRIDRRIAVPKPPPELGVKDFDWVWVEVEEFTPPPQPLRGRIVERLGNDDDRGIDVLLLLRDLGVVEEFPKAVEDEAVAIAVDWPTELRRRRDLRAVPTITIDPTTAKDFDDALSLERIEGGWRLFVHIADVAHFVTPGSALDDEARERSTSIYPVDRVVPMLPERLSNDLCSLRPREDRLTVTVEIDFDERGLPRRADAYDSVIHSNHRLTYEHVQQLFDGKDSGEGLDDVRPLIEGLRTLAKRLREERIRRGALDLDIPQLDVVFGGDGRVADLRFYPRYESHQLIEECMIAANEAVARRLTERSAPLLYRIHEPAEEDRLKMLEPVLKAFGIRVSLRGVDPTKLQAALRQAETMEAGHIVRRLILRALKRAEYAAHNAGHFGLASKCYCHFTSPIRRYPDVIAHRQIKAIARGEALVYPNDEEGLGRLDELAEHTSAQERRAQEAEREAQIVKALEFLERHVGDEFDAFISNVSASGLTVELTPWPAEGFVPTVAIAGDRYRLDDLGIALVGVRSGREYKLGMKVRVSIVRVDPMAQQMDLKLLVPEDEERPSWRRRRGR